MVRMAFKLSAQEKKDLDKYIKFLALKAAQIIVQSRLGEKVSLPCKTERSGDWFNLAIPDLQDVLAETKKALNGTNPIPTNPIPNTTPPPPNSNPTPVPPPNTTTRLPICVEISLRTPEGDQMVLESWCLGLQPQQNCDPVNPGHVTTTTTTTTHTVYNRMGILLKSLVSVTRVTPAYKLSRQQGPDSYVICYRIYVEGGGPQVHKLGEGYKEVRVGQICTPVGTVQLSVSYRTKMTITPTHSGRENGIMLKSDHFNSGSPRKQHNITDDQNGSIGGKLKLGAFADATKDTPEEPSLIIPVVPFSKLLSDRLHPQTPPAEDYDLPPSNNPPTSSSPPNSSIQKELRESEDTLNGNSPTSKGHHHRPQSNGNHRDFPEERDEIDSSGSSQGSPRCRIPSPISAGKELPKGNGYTLTQTNDDFIMVDLKTPFASTNSNSELGKFYREWQQAPPLKTFQEQAPVATNVNGDPIALDLTEQLACFELDMKRFDHVVQSLCQQSPNNN